MLPSNGTSNRAEAARLAGRIRASTNPGLRRTSISGALLFSLDAFENNGFQGLRRVIDVSGDGPNNQGRPVLRAREKVLARGVTINGLPLMTKDALSLMWGIADLDLYYENCVIGGPGSFVLPVHEWDEFAKAVKRKLVLEIAQAPLPVVPVQYSPPVDYDCLIGEKMWEQNRTFFDIP